MIDLIIAPALLATVLTLIFAPVLDLVCEMLDAVEVSDD